MKCGLIWARSARSSASMARVAVPAELGELELGSRPTGGDLLGGPGQARGGLSVRTPSACPTTRRRMTSGATTAGSGPGSRVLAPTSPGRGTTVRPDCAGPRRRAARTLARWCSPAPSQAASPRGRRWQGVGAEDGQQVACRRGSAPSDVRPEREVRGGERGRVQGGVRRPVDLGEEAAAAAAAPHPGAEPEQEQHARGPAPPSASGCCPSWGHPRVGAVRPR